jgi:hypothetical protein
MITEMRKNQISMVMRMHLGMRKKTRMEPSIFKLGLMETFLRPNLNKINNFLTLSVLAMSKVWQLLRRDKIVSQTSLQSQEDPTII